MTEPAPDEPAAPARVRWRGRVALRTSLALTVVGIVLVSVGAVLLARTSLGRVEGFARVPVTPAARTMQLQRTGDYVGYYETPAAAPRTATVRMTVTDAAGRPVRLSAYGSTPLTYDYKGRHGEARYRFTIAAPGTYTVRTVSSDDVPGAAMALGRSVAGSIAAGLTLLIPGSLLVAVAVVLLVVGLVRRGRHKAQANAPTYGPAGGGRYRGVG